MRWPYPLSPYPSRAASAFLAAVVLLIAASVVRSESVRNIIRERRMLEHVNHPFICNLRYSFQDIEYMYALAIPLPSRRPGPSPASLLASPADQATFSG